MELKRALFTPLACAMVAVGGFFAELLLDFRPQMGVFQCD
jgi:hypothetical protein